MSGRILRTSAIEFSIASIVDGVFDMLHLCRRCGREMVASAPVKHPDGTTTTVYVCAIRHACLHDVPDQIGFRPASNGRAIVGCMACGEDIGLLLPGGRA